MCRRIAILSIMAFIVGCIVNSLASANAKDEAYLKEVEEATARYDKIRKHKPHCLRNINLYRRRLKYALATKEKTVKRTKKRYEDELKRLERDKEANEYRIAEVKACLNRIDELAGLNGSQTKTFAGKPNDPLKVNIYYGGELKLSQWVTVLEDHPGSISFDSKASETDIDITIKKHGDSYSFIFVKGHGRIEKNADGSYSIYLRK